MRETVIAPLDTLAQVLDRPPAPPQDESKIDLDLATVCLKRLSKDPGQRYQAPGAGRGARPLAGRDRCVRGRRPCCRWRARWRKHHARILLAASPPSACSAASCSACTDGCGHPYPLSWFAGSRSSIARRPSPWLAMVIRLPGWSGPHSGRWRSMWRTTSRAAGGPDRVGPRMLAATLPSGWQQARSSGGRPELRPGLGVDPRDGAFGHPGGRPARSLAEVGLEDPRPGDGPRVYRFRDEMGRPSRIEIVPGWQIARYPNLRELPRATHADILRRKLRTEIAVGVQVGIWYCLLAAGSMVAVAAVEAAVAGSLLRRHGRVRPMIVGYIELVAPAVSLLYAIITLAINLMEGRPSFRPWSWATALVLAAASVAAATGRWPLPARRLIQIALLLVLIAIFTKVWPAHRTN